LRAFPAKSNQSVFVFERHFFKACFFGFPDSVRDGSVSDMHKSNRMTMMLSFLSYSTMSVLRFFAVTVALLLSTTAATGEQRSSLAFQRCTNNPSRIQEHRPSAFTGPSYHPRPATRTAGTRSSTSRSMLTEVLSEASTWISDAVAAVPVSPEPIHSAFTVATFLPQPFWLLIILLPNTAITKKIMGGLGT
jgi:hypothetical protein